MNLNVKWDITYKCNLNCAHCINGQLLGMTEDELDTIQVLDIIKKLKAAGVSYVHLLGGEPTARLDFLKIIKAFEDENLNFGFNTNGLKLKDVDYLDAIVNNKAIKNVVCSLEGPTAQINDQIRGKRVFEVTTENIRHLVANRQKLGRNDLKVTVNTVVSKNNISYIPRMISFCQKMGVDEIVLLQFIQEGNGANLSIVPSENEVLTLIETIADSYAKYKDKIEISPKFAMPLTKEYVNRVLKKEFPQTYSLCGAGDKFFYLNNKGELYPCDRYKDRINDLNDKEDINLVKNEFWNVADQPGFEEIYRYFANEKNYGTLYPCNDCQYLGEFCCPCPAQKPTGVISLCKRMKEKIENVSNL